MKYLQQFFIILLLSFVGEFLHTLIPLPVPAGIYGLILLFLLLSSGLLNVERVRDTGLFLVEIMPVMFIPAAVGLIDAWPVLQPVLLPITFIMIASTFIVMGVTGKLTDLFLTIFKTPSPMEKREEELEEGNAYKKEGAKA